MSFMQKHSAFKMLLWFIKVKYFSGPDEMYRDNVLKYHDMTSWQLNCTSWQYLQRVKCPMQPPFTWYNHNGYSSSCAVYNSIGQVCRVSSESSFKVISMLHFDRKKRTNSWVLLFCHLSWQHFKNMIFVFVVSLTWDVDNRSASQVGSLNRVSPPQVCPFRTTVSTGVNDNKVYSHLYTLCRWLSNVYSVTIIYTHQIKASKFPKLLQCY